MTQINGWTERGLERFWSRVTKTDECWNHAGAPNSSGYSQCFSQARGVQNAHKVSYEIHHGTVPQGMLVRHTCNNKRCVNPKHLVLGTHASNMQDITDAQTHPQRKLSQDEARTIRASDAPQRGLAKIYGVNQAAISNIRLGKTYREVGDLNDRAAKTVNFGRKNTPKEVIEQIRAATGTYKEIAATYGVSFSFVGRIKRGELCKTHHDSL